MAFLTWRADFEVGVPLIDSEHQALFKLINEFQDSCASGETRAETTQTLTKLVFYAEEHFMHEEAFIK